MKIEEIINDYEKKLGKLQYDFSEILIFKLDDSWEKTLKSTQKVERILDKSKDFSSVASKFSNAPSSLNSGRLGWVFENQIDAQVERNMAPDQYNGADAGFAMNDTSSDAYKEGERISRNKVIGDLKKSLIWNIKSIDGPKVTMAMDVLNQYNRKRNVYRRVDYDPINVIFHDTMSNSALKFWRYLYELNLKDGRNRSPAYSENASGKQTSRSPYQPNSLTDTDDFLANHNFGLDSSIINHTYPIKSLDLLVVHAKKYNLIRFIHPKVIAMQHDLFSYESSQPIEIGMQFAYETVVYETLNQPFDESGDLSVDLNQVFETEKMPDTPTTVQVADEGKSGTQQPNYDWTRLSSSSVGTDQTASTVGTGSNVMNAQSFDQQINSAGAAFRGSILGGTPVSDAINAASSEVYNTTKSAVSSFLGGGKSGGSGNSNFIGGLGDKFKSMGPGDGRYNPDSKNFKEPVGKGYVKDSKGRLVKDTNGNPVRGGNVYDRRDLNPGRGY